MCSTLHSGWNISRTLRCFPGAAAVLQALFLTGSALPCSSVFPQPLGTEARAVVLAGLCRHCHEPSVPLAARGEPGSALGRMREEQEFGDLPLRLDSPALHSVQFLLREPLGALQPQEGTALGTESRADGQTVCPTLHQGMISVPHSSHEVSLRQKWKCQGFLP